VITAGVSPAGATWWRPLVAALLLIGALAALYVTGTTVLGTGREPFSLTWQNGLALALCLASAAPLWRWLHTRVHELADSYHQPLAALSALSTPDPTPGRNVALAVAGAVNLPWVEIELDTISNAGRRPDQADVIEVPVEFQGDVFGVIRVGERRRVSRVTSADLAVLKELAHQLALGVAAERAAERLAHSRAEIVAAREEERLRIRRDLHDGLSPSLASIQLQLKALQRGMGEDDSHRPTIDGLLEDLRHTSADLRRVVYDLRPPMLDDLGLRGTLAHHFGAIAQPMVRLDFEDPAVPAAVEVALLRIATESVLNAVKHARATEVVVTICEEDGLVHLTVTDDGVGFGTDTIPGVGLSSMRERAEELGGTLAVESRPGSGTRIVASIGWSS
jgi:two-component system, NarL family, sensor kinase